MSDEVILGTQPTNIDIWGAIECSLSGEKPDNVLVSNIVNRWLVSSMMISCNANVPFDVLSVWHDFPSQISHQFSQEE